VQPMSRIDKVTAANMHRSWLNLPHVTQFDEADITELEAFRAELKAEGEKRGTRLTPLPFFAESLCRGAA
jgi:pyruvate dehydrogenase E2 component (dihydrolipoamide acetyltransferase)